MGFQMLAHLSGLSRALQLADMPGPCLSVPTSYVVPDPWKIRARLNMPPMSQAWTYSSGLSRPTFSSPCRASGLDSRLGIDMQ